nr:MAG TPA: hypothetical protein [Caudoviricetes sp.]
MNNFNHKLMMPQDMELSEFVSKTIIDNFNRIFLCE